MASYVGKTPARQAIVADNTITSAKIVDSTISTSDILDSTITGSDLASNIVINTTGSITSGALTACGLSYPTADGTSGQVIQTDGAGNLTFATASGGGGDVVDDTTPQLGGNLDLNSFDITGTNICIDASGCLGIGNQAAPTSSYNIDIAASGTHGNIRLQRANVSGQYMLIGVTDGSKHQIQLYGDKDLFICNRGANGSIYLATNTIDRTRIDRDGNTGFGKTSTCATQFLGSNTAYFCHTNNSTITGGNVIIGNGCLDTGLFINAGTAYCSVIFFDDGTTSATKVARIHYDHSDDSMSFATNVASGQNTESMRIDSSGNVLVGTTSLIGDSSRLSISYTYTNSGIGLKSDTTSIHNAIMFTNPNGTVGTIWTNGSSTAYNTSSDYRLKENVNYDFDATTRLKQLKPARFNFIADADTTVDGFLAHEVSSVVPEAIVGEKDAVNEDGSIRPQGIDQSKLVPLLVKTIQEAMERIETLEAEVATLKNQP